MRARLDFKAIKEAADFAVILERAGLTFKREGSELVGLCPFHDDHRPSFRANVVKGLFNCFSCSASGNVLDFVVRHQRLTVREAAERIVEWCALPPGPGLSDRAPFRGDGESGSHTTAPPTDPVASEVTPNPPLSFTLKLNPEHPYLETRGLTQETLAHFGLGYASRGLMKGRICVPIHNEAGELVAYAGRYAAEAIPEGENKYKFPPGFKKAEVLFNLHRVRDAEHLVVVEGYFSVTRLHELAIPAVAVMGSTVSPRQEELLLGTRATRLTLLFDPDEAGRAGAEDALSRLARHLFVRNVPLPQGSQPDTLAELELRRLLQEGS
jgi:DNA primase